MRYIPTDQNTFADYLSRGSPLDELVLRPTAWSALERRWGPHTVDRYATARNTQLRGFNSLLPERASSGASTLAQDWHGENNYVFPPVSELPRIAQLLHERPLLQATVIAPHWPAQAWFQQLVAIASHVETWRASAVAVSPAWLPGSARHALTGAMLTFFRVPGHLVFGTSGAARSRR